MPDDVTSALKRPDALIGTWRRFGPLGPVYEIIGPARPGPQGETLRIRVVESGEELDYPLDQLRSDPSD